MKAQKSEKTFTKFYYDPKKHSALTGSQTFRRTLKKLTGKNFSKFEVNSWLQGEDSYTLHKGVQKRFKRRRTIVGGINQQYQADLIDMQKYSSANNGNKFILTVIDVFSKRGWARVLKNKSANEVTKAMKSIISDNPPLTIHSDRGGEFLNSTFLNMLKTFDVKHFTTENDDIKASIVERWNRTIQQKIHRWFTKTNTQCYQDILPHLVNSYNSRPHSSTGIPPLEVNNSNSETVWLKMHLKDHSNNKFSLKPTLKIGDSVRIAKTRLTFDKGYTPNWSVEVFKVVNVIKSFPTVYRLKDLTGEEIKGTFYTQELQKVKLKNTFKIEKILKRKKTKSGEQYFVKWEGYPEKFNSWILKKDLIP